MFPEKGKGIMFQKKKKTGSMQLLHLIGLHAWPISRLCTQSRVAAFHRYDLTQVVFDCVMNLGEFAGLPRPGYQLRTFYASTFLKNITVRL